MLGAWLGKLHPTLDSVMLWQLLTHVGQVSYKIHVVEMPPVETVALLEDDHPAKQRLEPLLSPTTSGVRGKLLFLSSPSTSPLPPQSHLVL